MSDTGNKLLHNSTITTQTPLTQYSNSTTYAALVTNESYIMMPSVLSRNIDDE